MLKNKVTRDGAWTTLPKAAKQAAHRTVCPCCGRYYGYLTKVESKLIHTKEAIDHIFPRRWMVENFPHLNPHMEENLVSICNLCHGGKKVAEDSLYRGDVFEFFKLLIAIKYPVSRMLKMARLLKLKEVEGWQF